MCPLPYVLIQSHTLPAGCQGGEIWKPGWDVASPNSPKLQCPAQVGLANLEGSCTAVLWGRRETVVCVGWGQVPGALFQLHESKLTAPYFSSSPAPGNSLQAVSSFLGNAGFAWRRHEGTLFRGTRNGEPSRLPYWESC